MSELNERNTNKTAKNEMPILQLNRLNYAKINGRILETTDRKLAEYIAYASERMKTEITPGDVIEHGLKLLFDRDPGFKEWLKKN